MNYFKYYDEIVNDNNVENFYGKTNFIGYLIPDGSLYPCENHNIESLTSFFNMALVNLKNDYSNKELFLDEKSSDPLFQLALNFLWNASLDEIIKFDKFIHDKKLGMSDIIVSFFGCHLVTRLNKRILTSNVLHYPFYNYILMGFKIDTIPKIVYKNNDFCFYTESLYNNDFLMDEIEELNFVDDKEKKAFFR